MNNLIWSFSPWVAFLVGVRFGSVYWGAAIGIAVALVVLVRAISRHSVHLFDVIGVAYFGGLLALLAAMHPADIATWGRYAQAVAHGSLTVIVFGSILIGRPFTEPYARGAGAGEGLALEALPRTEPPDLGRLRPRLPRRHGVPRPGRSAGLPAVPLEARRTLRSPAPRLHVHPEAGGIGWRRVAGELTPEPRAKSLSSWQIRHRQQERGDPRWPSTASSTTGHAGRQKGTDVPGSGQPGGYSLGVYLQCRSPS